MHLFILAGRATKMTTADIVYDKIHFRHDPKWSGRLGPAEGGGLLLCVACVIEMLESDDVAVKNIWYLLYYMKRVLSYFNI